MSWGYILTGAVIGIGGVAAAPFTGGGSVLGATTLIASLSGAGTIATAVGTGVLGATGGAFLADSENTEQNNSTQDKTVEDKAKDSVKLEKLVKGLNSSLEKLESHDEHFKAIIALEAVGVSCATCDGSFSEKEKREISKFVKGMLDQKIPEDVKEKIQSVYDNPLNINEAFKLAQDSGLELEAFDDVILYTMKIDGVTEKELNFFHAWQELRMT
ncbi:DUF533 domain-containing protein [Candidatus Gracilibacteria bacterium]|nr:DUF533 domain-containing protein [Candidatus Gracilibacteria bacterium]